MTYVTAAPRAEISVNAGWISGLIETAKLAIARRRSYRQTYDELSMMTERELADINLSSLDIRDVARDAAARIG